MPDWVPAALARAPWVVVRRARPVSGAVPVGVRGAARGERWGAFVAPSAVAAHLSPEDIAASKAWQRLSRTWVPALRLLDILGRLLGERGLAWGPTGSVGFELASGIATANEESDLDVLIRTPQPMSLGEAREISGELARLPVRVDAQLELPGGAVSLVEYARGKEVLLRTPDGPRLVRSPWQPAVTGGKGV